MRVELRLKSIIERNGLGGYGKFSRIERETGISRRVVEAFYENKRRSISLDQIEQLCDWLRRRHVTDDLPGALFGRRPSRLLNALAEPGRVRFYLGEYRQRESANFPRTWVARADAQLAAVFTELLSGAPGGGTDHVDERRRVTVADASGTQFEYLYVPSHFTPFGPGAGDAAPDRESTDVAGRMFEAMRHVQHPGTNILIGSQAANHLVELFVADLLGCRAFAGGRKNAPLYLYRPAAGPELMPSCFGGFEPPTGWRGDDEPGIYYRNGAGGWSCYPSNGAGRDAGIVIVRRDRGTGHTEMAVFGFSGRATAAMGDVLRRNPDAFWTDLEPLRHGIEARVHVCEIGFPDDGDRNGAGSSAPVQEFRVTPLDLKRRARSRPRGSTRRSV